jgi:tRNA threonylcarbamoyl adenosine modification protein (Sua5/YciO/YrdC/YwlC family)
MILELHPVNPEERKLKQIIEVLEDGGVIIYPTDTVYALGCDINNQKAIEKICLIKGIKPEKATLSFICSDLSNISSYTRPFSNEVYKLMKRSLPGPYTFILNANNDVPKLLKNKRKTVGIRVPDNKITRALVEMLGRPILSTSLKYDESEEDVLEYPTDPWEIHEAYGNRVAMVIDGGIVGNTPSSIIDCTGDEPVVIR